MRGSGPKSSSAFDNTWAGSFPSRLAVKKGSDSLSSNSHPSSHPPYTTQLVGDAVVQLLLAEARNRGHFALSSLFCQSNSSSTFLRKASIASANVWDLVRALHLRFWWGQRPHSVPNAPASFLYNFFIFVVRDLPRCLGGLQEAFSHF